ncbi:MAG: hypothetical protein IJO63_01270 [Bacilli bacterium]|nr:hypothetical protein [Bacilli bacterium]
MKNEKVAIYLSFLSMIIFLFSACICFIKVNKRVDNIESTPTVAIFNFDHTSSSMNINPFDMFSAKEEAIASNTIELSVTYSGATAKAYPFKIIMDNYTSYTKSEGVDGVNSFEYTYEILKDGTTVQEEKEITSYTAGSKLDLYEEELMPSDKTIKYSIVYRFYANEYDQNHLMGTSLSSNLKIEPISSSK